MVMVAPLPFKATKAFVLNGHTVARGEVVDVSMLKVSTVVNLERGNYGIRVASQEAVAERPRSKPSPRRKSSGASASKE